MSETYEPITVSVPQGDLRYILQRAKQAAEELQFVAQAEYPGDHPVEVRRRNRDMADAQQLIDAVDLMLALPGVKG